jgi:phosphoribosylaminoimidazolecarboxamide formyltransferase / IMP cyclohydrolase
VSGGKDCVSTGGGAATPAPSHKSFASGPDLVPIKRALLSVFDKTGIVAFAKDLASRGVELVSTGGTSKALKDAGLKVVDVSDLTGFPEMLDGRVKTLHPKVHGGLLYRRDDPAHAAAVSEHEIRPIDLVVVNLYPFEATVAKKDASEGDVVEMIDIGGPAMIRAACKNFDFVVVATEPSDLDAIAAELSERDGSTTRAFRRRQAARAFAKTASYDAAIARWMEEERFPPRLTLSAERVATLRYGENPHQGGALYRTSDPGEASIAHARQLSGKELSFNNLLDADAALGVVRFLMYPACVVVKHKNPCGAATHPTDLRDAFERAYLGDPTSAYGGILAFNRPVTPEVARAVATPGKFFEVIVAPGYEGDALETLTTGQKWGKNVRILETTHPFFERRPVDGLFDVRAISGGYLVQDRDASIESDFKVVTKREPSREEWADLRFAWEICRHVGSNAIVIAKNATLLGCGAGQMSRVDSCLLASKKAAGADGLGAKGAVLASDAFFPFADGLIVAADSGVTAAIHPGGSMRDDDVVKAADLRGMALVATGVRHFRH